MFSVIFLHNPIGITVPMGLILPTQGDTMQQQESVQLEIEHLLFELNCCVTDLSRYRLQIKSHDIQQAELGLHKFESLISFLKQFDTQLIAY